VAEPGPLAGRYRAVAFDLDGTVYLGDEVVPGAPAAVQGVRELGVKVAFVTNNAVRPPAAVVEKLSRLGVKATTEEVLTSAQAVVHLLGGGRGPHGARGPHDTGGLHGTRVLVVGGPGLREALAAAGAHLLEPDAWRQADVVVAGLDPELSYAKVRAAALAIAAGARFVGSNPDASLPTPQGPWPGAGSVLALLSTATGARPEIAGKPERALFETVAAALGPGPRLMVGDRADTDLAGAQELGWGTALVLTGSTRPAGLLDVPAEPDHLLADVGGLLEPAGPELRADAAPGRLRLVAAHGGTGAVAGSLTCGWNGDQAVIEELSVQQAWRGRLVGTRLLLGACVRLRAAGVRQVRARPDSSGGFFARLGFTPGRGGDGPLGLGRDLAPSPPRST